METFSPGSQLLCLKVTNQSTATGRNEQEVRVPVLVRAGKCGRLDLRGLELQGLSKRVRQAYIFTSHHASVKSKSREEEELSR